MESQTRQQSACQEWYKDRFGRVIASKSYSVGCSHKADASQTKIIKEVQLNLDYPDSLGPHEIVRIIEGPDNQKYEY